ncbi:MAG: hypothetical protein IPG50_19545 [Myxococcales bacterium]|nr:hypothetical protein [Myxococcales bacterium]
MSRKSAAGAVMIALLALLAAACETEVGPREFSPERSLVLGTTANVVTRIVTDEANAYWFDNTGRIFSCPKTGCGGAPQELATAGPAWPAGQPVDAPAAAVAVEGALFYLFAGELYRCASTGCGGRANVVLLSAHAPFVDMRLVGRELLLATADSTYRCPASDCNVATLRMVVGTCRVDTECPQGTTCVGGVCSACTNTCASGLPCLAGRCVACDGDYGTGSRSPCASKDRQRCVKGACEPCSVSNCAPGCAPQGHCPRSCTAASDCTDARGCSSQCAASTCTNPVCIPQPPGEKSNGDACKQSLECRSGSCAKDGRCGQLDGEACSSVGQNPCRNGTCSVGKCGGEAPSGSIAAHGDTFYFLRGTSLVACSLSSCATTERLVSQSAGADARIALADDANVLLSTTSGLRRCVLPACEGDLPLVTGPASGVAPGFVGDELVYGDGAATFVCPRAGCSGAPTMLRPEAIEPRLDKPSPSRRVAAVEPSRVVWATSSLYGNPGATVLVTPR